MLLCTLYELRCLKTKVLIHLCYKLVLGSNIQLWYLMFNSLLNVWLTPFSTMIFRYNSMRNENLLLCNIFPASGSRVKTLQTNAKWFHDLCDVMKQVSKTDLVFKSSWRIRESIRLKVWKLASWSTPGFISLDVW